MKIINQIKEEINVQFIGLVVFFELIFLSLVLLVGFIFYKNWSNIKDHFSSYKMCGEVLEYGSNASVPDFRINLGSERMYSIHNGSYCWENLSKDTQLSFETPQIYESDKTEPANYTSYKELSPFARQIEHNFKLVLGIEATAERILDYQKDGVSYSLWNYLTKSSKKNWSNKDHDFNKALSTERSLRIKIDKSQIVDYEIIGEKKVTEEEYRYEVLWQRANGNSFVQTETFVKQDDWWHYEYPRLPKEVYDYIYIAEKEIR